MNIERFVNFNPKKIKKAFSTTEMIEFLDAIKFPILVLPVVDNDDMLCGAISFHKLLKED
jgi:Mg/Co/Ni transporter MgtE